MTSLTAQEKYRLDYCPPAYWIDSVDLDIQLDDHQTRVVAISRVRRNGNHNDPLVLDGEGMKLLSVSLDGLPCLTWREASGQLSIANVPDEFILTIENLIDPANNTALEGIYKSGDAFCSQCEAEGFRRITYYLDRPDVLARFTTRISADKQRYPFLLSNGNRVGSGDLDNGRHWVSWQDPFPKPCYLFALVAGDFDVLRDQFTTRSGRQVALELFVDKGNLDRAPHAMDSLKKAMAWDEQRFGLEYDLDIYMIVAVDFFNMGAMENKGLNIFNSRFVLANPATATDTDYFDIERVIGHEYFHNWTGNRITCRDWFQLSLKEGLTVFRDQEFSSDLGSRAVNRIRNVRLIRGPQFAEDAGPMAHPIRPDVVIEMNNFYTVTVYEKGSEVIRMLHTLLGEADFQRGMQIYVERHDGEAATCEQFVQAMEAASGRDLTLFRRWYSQAGTPVLTVRSQFDAQAGRFTLHLQQMTPPTAQQQDKLPLHIPVSIALYSQQGEALPLLRDGQPVSGLLELTAAAQEFSFDASEAPVVALLQEFSAPVRLDYPYTDEALSLLLAHADNDVVRWDAAQMLINRYVIEAVNHWLPGRLLPVPTSLLEALGAVLADTTLDPALAAEILTLPGEGSLLELFAHADVDAIHAVRQHLATTLAEHLHSQWLACYQANHQQGEYRIDGASMGHRALANLALSYLARIGQEDYATLISRHYHDANNMTDTLAAMLAASAGQLSCLDTLLADFEQRWQHDGLVMDNWFRLQAMRSEGETLSRVKQLLSHPTFSMQNPNRVRALIGSFAAANPTCFHAKDGSGYRFLSGMLRQLNDINPQVAARMIVPMIQFGKLDSARQTLIRTELQALAALPNLARDLYEKITRALAQ